VGGRTASQHWLAADADNPPAGDVTHTSSRVAGCAPEDSQMTIRPALRDPVLSVRTSAAEFLRRPSAPLWCFHTIGSRMSSDMSRDMSSDKSPSVNGSIEKHAHILEAHVAPLRECTPRAVA